MKLKACVELNREESKRYSEILKQLEERFDGGQNFRKQFENYHCTSAYASIIHKGNLKKGIKVTELELSMLCDAGYGHFGGYSSLEEDGTFTVKIYTD